MLISVLLLSLSLSADSLGIGMSLGLRKIYVPVYARIASAILCFFITGISVLSGKFLSGFIPDSFTATGGAVFLIFLGIFIIYKALKNEAPKNEASPEKTHTFIFKSLGITVNIISSPIICDMDGSKTIDIKEAAYLGAALSIDSFGVGLSFAVGNPYAYLMPFMTAFSQLIFLSSGLFIGNRFKTEGKDKVFTVLSGIIILSVAILRLM